jgi:signal transduction histidine kinase
MRTSPDLAEAREAASRVVKDATRAVDIVSRIRLLFAKGAPERTALDVNDVVREMLLLLRGETARYGIAVRTELAAGLSPTLADRVQVQQILMNLIVNSIDAMKDVDGSRELVIASQSTDQHVVVAVSDSGPGLPADHAAQIFNAFFTTKVNGTGMGLSISRSIVESHGGSLWATGNPGGGATFHFTLPAAAASNSTSPIALS